MPLNKNSLWSKSGIISLYIEFSSWIEIALTIKSKYSSSTHTIPYPKAFKSNSLENSSFAFILSNSFPSNQ